MNRLPEVVHDVPPFVSDPMLTFGSMPFGSIPYDQDSHAAVFGGMRRHFWPKCSLGFVIDDNLSKYKSAVPDASLGIFC
jgi:hypothetical protein